MSRLHAVHGPAALQALTFITGWAGGYTPIYRDNGGGERITWHEMARPRAITDVADLVRSWDEKHSYEVTVGLPQLRMWNGGVGAATVLWVRVEGAEQSRRAAKLRPLPSMVLREGASSRRWLIWALRERATYFAVQAANRRLAFAIGAVQKHGDPDAFRVPAPSTCLRVGRSRPVPVVCSRLTLEDFTVDQVVGRLREPPELKPWWERKAQ